MVMWTVQIRDLTAHTVQSDLDKHCPQKFLALSSVRKELAIYQNPKFYYTPTKMSVFGDILESACLSVRPSVYLYVRLCSKY